MKLNNLRIGVRLGGGFAAVLALLALMMAIGIWQLSSLAAANREMMATPLEKERIVGEQFRNVAVGVRRTTAIAKSSDQSMEQVFAAETKASTLRGAEIMKTIASLLTADNEKKLWAAVAEARGAYLKSRDAVMALKKEGKTDESGRVFEVAFLPRSAAYIAAMQAFLDLQRSNIDSAALAIADDAARARIGMMLVGTAALLIGSMFALLLTRSITQPLLGAGRLAQAVASGDLSQHVRVEGRDEIAQLMRSLAGMNTSLHRMVTQVRNSTHSISTASGEIAVGNKDLANRTEQTASNLQSAASSMDQLTSTVKLSADSARQANQLASSAGEVAARGGKVVSQVVATMNEINASSKKIADIIGTIDGIAFQTNILALNAAVEGHVRASRAAALRWSPARCAASRIAAPRPPRRSRT